MVNSNPVIFISFSARDESFDILSIPSNTYIEVPHGYGFYQARSVFGLGEIEEKGGMLFKEAIQEFLGLPVDGWLAMKNDEWKIDNGKEGILKLRNKLFGVGWLKKMPELRTNFNLWDLLRFWLKIGLIRPDKINFIDLKENSCLSDFILADGTVVLKDEVSCLDSIAKKYFIEEEIRQEGLSIKIVNTTNFPGLGVKAARLVDNIGGRVLRVESAEEERIETEILVEKRNLEKKTLRRISKGLNAKIVEGEPEDFDVVIFLGKDYQKKLEEK